MSNQIVIYTAVIYTNAETVIRFAETDQSVLKNKVFAYVEQNWVDELGTVMPQDPVFAVEKYFDSMSVLANGSESIYYNSYEVSKDGFLKIVTGALTAMHYLTLDSGENNDEYASYVLSEAFNPFIKNIYGDDV